MKKRVTLTFPKRAIQMPVTYRLAKDFNVAANIIRAQVAPNQIGKLVVELLGDIDQLDAAIEWMRSQHIHVSLGLGEILIDEKLVNVFDQLSHQLNDFFYGRYDIMCYSIEDLKEGNNYSILEYNGCGAEPNHFYDTGYTLLGAYKEILSHWKDLYEISSYNSAQGTKPWSFMKGYRFLKKTKELYAVMRKADKALG
jgi:hypothetical protein